MIVRFHTMGMSFVADVDYFPGCPGTYWEPPEPDELDINRLCVDGHDAMFLMDSTLCDEIEEAALLAARESHLTEDEMCHSF